jgi:pentatricopeptide repeat protein
MIGVYEILGKHDIAESLFAQMIADGIKPMLKPILDIFRGNRREEFFYRLVKDGAKCPAGFTDWYDWAARC